LHVRLLDWLARVFRRGPRTNLPSIGDAVRAK
jgi:hypothetical protein